MTKTGRGLFFILAKNQGSVAAVAKVNGDLICQTELVFIVGDRDGKDMQAKIRKSKNLWRLLPDC